MRLRTFSFLLLSLIVATLSAAIPTGYYDNLEGKSGSALASAVTAIAMQGHSTMSYGALWTAYKTTDYENEKVLDMYSNVSWTYQTNQCGNYGKEGDCYNREHSIPQSWFNEKPPMVTDIIHVVPSDGFVNGKRGNYPYGEVGTPSYTSGNGSKLGNSSFSGYSGVVFEPIDLYKGDFARINFYMALRYAGVNLSSGLGSVVFTSGTTDLTDYAQNLFLKWHRTDAVSSKETKRNDGIQDTQGNRNPFVDLPHLAEYIWGENRGKPFSVDNISGGKDAEDFLFEESFINTLGDFTTQNLLGEQGWLASQYGALANGYRAGQGALENEDWLVSPTFDLSTQQSATLRFEHAFGFAGDPTEMQQAASVRISNNYHNDVTTATWSELEIAQFPTPKNNGWSDFIAMEIALPTPMLGANTTIAFKYTSTNTKAVGWEIKNLNIRGVAAATSTPVTTLPKPMLTLTDRALWAQGEHMQVYDITGRIVGSGVRIQLPQAGIYLVKTPYHVQKVITP